MIFKTFYSHPLRFRRGVSQGSVIGPVLISLSINDLPAVLPSTVKVSLYPDNLVIGASPNVERAAAAVQTALRKLVEWSSKWRLPLNPLKCNSSFFSLDPCQSHLKLFLSILNIPLNFNPNPTFLGVILDQTLSFKHHFYFMKEVFTTDVMPFTLLPLLPKPLQRISLYFIKKTLFALFLPMFPQDGFLYRPPFISPPWRECTDPPVEQSQAVCHQIRFLTYV